MPQRLKMSIMQKRDKKEMKKVSPPSVPESKLAEDCQRNDGGCSQSSSNSFISAQGMFAGGSNMKRAELSSSVPSIEDQGIDMAQSPGRTSPTSSGSLSSGGGGGCRNSICSTDSGRASSAGSWQINRWSGSSIHSLEDMDAARLLQLNLPEDEVVKLWLSDLHFEEYAFLFIKAGYDLPTIALMTPQDLTAIGIVKPIHRRKITEHINTLQLPDPIPNFIPDSLELWLRALQLDEYLASLQSEGYHTVQDATELTWEDLEDIGISRLGHQKKILHAIKRVRDILSGKRTPTANPPTLLPFSHAQNFQEIPILTGPHPSSPSREIVPLPSLKTFNPGHTVTVQIHQTHSRGKSLDLQQEPEEWRRSYDDGDITPTNEPHLNVGSGTLPRPRAPNRPRPVARVAGNARWVGDTDDVNAVSKWRESSPVGSDISDSDLLVHQRRHDSLTSFKSSSSTESDSLPFANENAGTIKQRANRPQGVDVCSPETEDGGANSSQIATPVKHRCTGRTGDVLSEIGSMLSGLTQELDAMLEAESDRP